MSDLGNKKIMADNLKRLMDSNGISRNRLCHDLGLKYSTVSEWLNATAYPRIDKIELLANYFHVQKSDLVECSNQAEVDFGMLRCVVPFSERLQEAITERNISKKELSRRTNISLSTINNYLAGKSRYSDASIVALSNALSVNEAWLVGDDETPMNRGIRKHPGEMGYWAVAHIQHRNSLATNGLSEANQYSDLSYDAREVARIFDMSDEVTQFLVKQILEIPTPEGDPRKRIKPENK